MKGTVEIFSELGRRLASFGCDDFSHEVVVRANEANPWFRPDEVIRAVGAVRECMLDSDAIETWLASYPEPRAGGRRVAVVMAGNIPLVGFADLMYVIAAGDIPYVKYSGKDSVLMPYVADMLRDIEPELRIERYEPGVGIDAAITSGSDSASLHFASEFAGVPKLLRGSRHSAAVLTGSETAADMEALSDDIFLYSGLGCRNVSLIFAPRFFELAIPARHMCAGYHNNYLRSRALLAMRGVDFMDTGEAVFVEGDARFSDDISRINVCRYENLSEVSEWLESHDPELQCVASSARLHPRTVPLGRTQYPGLGDYADGADVMKFLLSL